MTRIHTQKKSYLKVYSKESNNQSHFTMSCLCIQTGNVVSKLNVFSHRPSRLRHQKKWLMIKNNALFTESDMKLLRFLNPPSQIHFIALCYDIDIKPKYSI